MPINHIESAESIPAHRITAGTRYALHEPSITEVKAVIRRLEKHNNEPDLEVTCRGHGGGWVSFGISAALRPKASGGAGQPKGPLRTRIEAMTQGEEIEFSLNDHLESAVRVTAHQVGKSLGRKHSANRSGSGITVKRME